MPFDGPDRDEDWNEVWSEYDHRRGMARGLLPKPVPAGKTLPLRRDQGRRSLLFPLLIALLLVFGIGLVAPSWIMARDFAAKLRHADGATLLQMANQPSLRGNLWREFLLRADAEDLSPTARNWLADMAGDMVAGWNDPNPSVPGCNCAARLPSHPSMCCAPSANPSAPAISAMPPRG
ncbi:hypothetical protein MVG78_19080 [Roseomonas gilardii subsp. gilardii]|uniref:hypothetical protein n=1 Tax=Roseomonas gilardii TaxID=257708 RepID=UPI001FF859FA|nr:hypothetical protein [Roseomonas gilardii]UPG72547.1 hypothetical protein MVG78_19080 [Roseomonas gilardii subsp. gilardii]